MPLFPGARLGPYEVIASAGAGGMGEVWKARDTRLARSVAIKVLPAEFAQNAQLKLRFEREAKSISQLNHPHICTLYDVGNQDGIEYLVMEYLDGETLADRLNKGPLPLDQVIRYGIEIAEALDRAHKAGIVHRDLKPGNVMLTKSGAKLLDFGLAKSGVPVVSGHSTVTPEDATVAALAGASPGGRPLTEEGTILGTFQYMAPEQIEGKDADARTDIFALGALLYEMATGRRAFQGKSRASLIASILATDPQPVGATRPASPESLDRLIRGCLEKDPDARWQSAHDVAMELRAVNNAAPAAPHKGASRAVSASVVMALVAIAAAAGWMLHRQPPSATVQFDVASPAGTSIVVSSFPAVSPDGNEVAFAAEDRTGHAWLWMQSLRTGQLRRVANSEGVDDPAWSPDGTRIAFIDERERLQVVSLAGGTVQTIVPVVRNPNGTMWLDNNTLVFSNALEGLYQVDVAGGAPRMLLSTASLHAAGLSSPRPAAGGAIVFRRTTPRLSESTIDIRLADGRVKTLARGNGGPWSAPAGFVLFGRNTDILLQKLDEKGGSTVGDARQVGVGTRAAFAGSTLCYVAAANYAERRLVIRDRAGQQRELVAPGFVMDFRVSPDGRQVALDRGLSGDRSIWIYDIARSVLRRVSFGSDDFDPVWSRDGRRIIYSSSRQGGPDIFWTSPAGTGLETPLVRSSDVKLVDDVAPDGRVLFVTENGATGGALWTGGVEGQPPTPFLQTPFITAQAVFSPDGKYIAYRSDEAGMDNIFVVDYPNAEHKWQISTEKGYAPKWSRDGSKLFFVSDGTLEEVPIRNAQGAIEPGKPVPIFGGLPSDRTRDVFEPLDDGTFIVAVASSPVATQLHVIANWHP